MFDFMLWPPPPLSPSNQPTALALPIYAHRERVVGLLTAVSEELQDVPLHYTLPDLSGTLHCTCPKMDQFKVIGSVLLPLLG